MLLRYKAAVTMSAVLLAAGAALVFAPAAFAADNQTLCVNDQASPSHTQCAYLDVSSGFVDTKNVSSAPSATDYHWDINTSSTGYHQISSVDSAATGCMWFSGPSSPQIMIAGCDGSAYEEWKIVATSSTGQVELQNEEYPGDCLNDHYQLDEVNAAPCSTGQDQLWATYAITIEN
jgi:hypothetical protein